MIKVRVRRAGTGVAAASGIIALSGGQTGCVAEPVEIGELSIAEAADALTPGQGALALDGFPGQLTMKLASSTTDEFLRAGESLTFELPAWLLWELLYPANPVPNDVARLQMLGAVVKVRAMDKDKVIATSSVPVIGFSAGDVYSIDALTKAFFVPSKADWLTFEVSITDAMDPAASATIAESSLSKFAVFGGEMPNKSLFMDSVQSTKRHRIIEGDDPVAAAELLFAYSDWRADVVVDKSQIDTQIGTAETASRFGWVTVPIFGRLEHEVSYGVFFDDGEGWRTEAPLLPNTSSKFVANGRTTFETTLVMPAKSRRMLMYVHVKTFLVADYTGIQNITAKWYADGAHVLKVDAYDNPAGSFTNYAFSIAKEPH